MNSHALLALISKFNTELFILKIIKKNSKIKNKSYILFSYEQTYTYTYILSVILVEYFGD